MKKVVVIKGNPRKNANIATLLQKKGKYSVVIHTVTIKVKNKIYR